MFTKLLYFKLITITCLSYSFCYKNSNQVFLKPERVEKIATKLLQLTLNTSHVQISHCLMQPYSVYQKGPTIHFHVNVISNVFIDMPIYVRKNITVNILQTLMDKAGPHDLSLDCFCGGERPDGFLPTDLQHQDSFAIGEHVIQDILEEEFNKTFIPTFFYVENVCEHYGIQRSQESHFQIVIVADVFEGKSVAERRFMVDEIVRKTMAHGIVRLFLKLFTEPEWKKELEMEKEHGDRRYNKYYDQMKDYATME
uniref:BolA-like protein n=1 Tax=Pachypsylla venusta TaxID=38123 RepID=A0A0A1HAT9_PACVE|nr:BolA-like protein [Pachypsylla venusta]BAP90749.1 BolA-like protein [Pachypsylla venusta]